MLSMNEWVHVILIGVGATIFMDIWGLIQKAMGVATLNYAMVGRWAGHLLRGQVAHSNIGKAAPIAGESPLGWVIHYAVGIAFAFLLIAVYGTAWLQDPRWLPAVLVGTVTVVMPFFVMQPAMGAGVAASRTPAPWTNRLRSLMTHAIFGLGMYLSALLLQQVA
ncbi:DUF2938 domain-containing protein [Alcaligenes sp. SORT26]|uniref:DUF2938 domain-containing protein n=1 Tax=Alcaligenes sp. SORT26 TaxID=2813780 RepID=UPI001A9D763B|nr:DUF2938 domain-containing protein [Alcaligenes sp. SORT26]QTB98828.1 DUF2938 domain-containing protein [Alcaligenes sp. SORT26]